MNTLLAIQTTTDALLRELGLEDNTIVFFAGDNGGHERFRTKEHPHGFFGPNLNPKTGELFRGAKGNLYEGGLRIPSMARWPGKIKAGSTCKETVGLNDFMATVADILKVKLDENTAEDSYSILPLLTGEKDSLPDRPMVVNHDYGGKFAIRNGKWKYVPHANQLFDLDKDQKETKNVAKEYPEVLKKMKTTLDKYKTSGRSR